MVRMTEIYFNSQQLFQFDMLLQKNIIIRTDTTKLRKSFLNFLKCHMNISYRDIQNLFQETDPAFAVSQGQNDALACFTRDQEIRFCVSNILAILYVYWRRRSGFPGLG